MSSKRILSIDVGIVNLGICLLDVSKDHPPRIIEWESIDLLDRKHDCASVTCKHKARFITPSRLYLCKRCANRRQEPIVEADWLALDRPKCSKRCMVPLACRVGILEADALCADDLRRALIKHRNECMIMPVLMASAKNVELVEVGRALQSALDARQELHEADAVVIENQISPLASRMKTIQGMIAQYFIRTGVASIEFISAANKLKPFLAKGQRTTYKERKALSISVVRELLDKDEARIGFEASSKKDDLADSYLQALAYAHQRDWIDPKFLITSHARST